MTERLPEPVAIRSPMAHAMLAMAYRRAAADAGDETSSEGSPLVEMAHEPELVACLRGVHDGTLDREGLGDELGGAFDELLERDNLPVAAQLVDALAILAVQGPVYGLGPALLLRADLVTDPLEAIQLARAFLALIDGLDDVDDLRADAYATLGAAYEEAGRFRDAFEALTTAYGLSPDDDQRVRLMNALAVLYAYQDEAHLPEAADDVAEGRRLLAMPELSDQELRGDIELQIATALMKLGELDQACEILQRVYDEATDASQRLVCAGELAAAYADAERPVEAADWAWKVGHFWEELEVTVEPDDLHEIVRMQMAAVIAQRAAEQPMRLSRVIWERVLKRPEWWPPEATTSHFYGLAAQLATVDNDPANARDFLEVAKAHLDVSDEDLSAELALVEGELACLQSDLGTLELAVRVCSAYVTSRGDDEQRSRLKMLLQALDQQREFQSDGDGSSSWDSPLWRALIQVHRAIGGQRADSTWADGLLLNLIGEAHPVEDGPLIGLAHAYRAVHYAADGKLPQARAAIAQARDALAYASAHAIAGFPSALSAQVDLMAALVEVAGGINAEAIEQVDALWRSSVATAPPSFVVGGAAAAAAGWLAVEQPHRAMAAAVAAVTMAEDLTRSAVDSEDRALRREVARTIMRPALQAAAALEDPRLMAEVLEVVRAQAMPVATQVDPGWDGSFRELLATLHAASDPLLADRGESASSAAYAKREGIAVRLAPAPFVVMPWGSIALAEWLAYDRTVQRGTAVLQIGGTGID